PIKRGLASLVHPAASLYDAQQADAQREAHADLTRPLSVVTEDGVALDGCIVSPARPSRRQRPVLVMVLGNAMYYETCLPLAATLADACKIEVMLYNGRGVGRSAGQETGTADAVRDCRAVLRHAAERYHNVGVYGFSLGGGISAVALKTLRLEEPVAMECVGLYLNVNSFPSLHHCVGGIFAGVLGGLRVAGESIFGSLARGTFWLTGFDPLDAQAAIASTRLAEQVVVMCAERDEVMRGGGRLADALAHVANPANDICIWRSQGTHNDVEIDGLLDILTRWRKHRPMPTSEPPQQP
ncbi:MAG TPA: alpha/beta hydrolase, partial [Myxococcota bacterium]|nr:alpha/beta hydrolase [Myxococcota bacterium]